MRVVVKLFATYAEAFGGQEIALELPAGAKAADVVAAVLARPEAARLPPAPAVAINLRYARPDSVVHQGDEVALIPPVAGG
jgi:molybdopterin converting factor small subunit